MSDARRELLEQYRRALKDHLGGAGEAALARAYELGRNAIAQGFGVLEMAALHHDALQAAVSSTAVGDRATAAEAAHPLFMESLSPFEMTHRAYREANTALRRLNEKLEEETKRIAHALHDEAGQLLASVHVALATLSRELPPPLAGRLGEVRGLLDRIEGDLRRLSHELRPTILDDLGLVSALEFLAEGTSKRSGLLVTVSGSTEGRLPPKVETALYRIVQETLTNAARHAHAAQVEVRLQREPRAIRCAVRDDGVGFDVPAILAPGSGRGLGLAGIRERLDALGGTLQITSAPGRGTTVLATLPLEA